MIVKALTVGPMMANCFILACEQTNQAVVIDPGDDTDRILLSLAESKLKLIYIINTHGHFDHVGGNNKLKAATGAGILIHPLDAPMLGNMAADAAAWGLGAADSPPADQTVQDGDKIQFGRITLEVLHTPGHTPGGISLYTEGYVFVGDTLFAGSIGRTDFPGGDFAALISGIRNKLFILDDEVEVFTGHGPQTTIGHEKRFNPFAGQQA